MQIKFLALILGIFLLTSIITPAFANHLVGHPKPKPSLLSLDLLPECINTLQCNAPFVVGSIVTFTGILTDEGGTGLPDAEINIYRLSSTTTKLLTSTVTTDDGSFEATWKARFFENKPVGETFTKVIDEPLTIFVRFEGDDNYGSSQSGKIIIIVKLKDMITLVASDKNLYGEGDQAVIFINFIEMDNRASDRYGDFIDPDSMTVFYDLEPVELSKKKLGSHTFITPPLTVGHHQLMINPTKEDYNNRAGFVTVQVSGFFGK
ncbi:MAG: hypothetical protein ACE5KA_06860 [Nitrososphaerales archaeon]